MKKIISILLVLVLVTAAAGCSDQAKSNDITVTDSRGVAVQMNSLPQKIVSLTPSDTEILYALGAGDRVIAVSEYCNYPEDVKKKQKLPTGEKLSMESLLALKADVIFLGKMSVMEDQIKQLEESGAKIIITEANTLEETYKVIEMIGAAVGKTEEAASVIAGMKAGFEKIRSQAAHQKPVKVYVEVSPLEYGLWSCGKGTFVQELLDMTGAQNIFSDVEGWSAVSEEQVLERNPDIILTTASPLTGIEDPAGEISGRANWTELSAVKNGKVFMLDADMLSRPGPRLVDAAHQIQETMKE